MVWCSVRDVWRAGELEELRVEAQWLAGWLTDPTAAGRRQSRRRSGSVHRSVALPVLCKVEQHGNDGCWVGVGVVVMGCVCWRVMVG